MPLPTHTPPRQAAVHALARIIQAIVANGRPITDARGIRDDLQRVAMVEDDLARDFGPAWQRARVLMVGSNDP